MALKIPNALYNQLRRHGEASYPHECCGVLVGEFDEAGGKAVRGVVQCGNTRTDSPANRFLFIDVNPGSICTPAFGVDMNEELFVHYPSTLHGGLGVVSFADNHVESHKWLDLRTTRAIANGQQYIPHNEPSPNNQDLRWIGDRTTSKK